MKDLVNNYNALVEQLEPKVKKYLYAYLDTFKKGHNNFKYFTLYVESNEVCVEIGYTHGWYDSYDSYTLSEPLNRILGDYTSYFDNLIREQEEKSLVDAKHQQELTRERDLKKLAELKEKYEANHDK